MPVRMLLALVCIMWILLVIGYCFRWCYGKCCHYYIEGRRQNGKHEIITNGSTELPFDHETDLSLFLARNSQKLCHRFFCCVYCFRQSLSRWIKSRKVKISNINEKTETNSLMSTYRQPSQTHIFVFNKVCYMFLIQCRCK